MTDGVLLAEIAHDRLLRQYDTIILDEAHERSLNIDFLLGYLAQLLPRRPDLKLVITSATIDVERVAEHFARARPVVEVSGRTYPVEVRYRPVVDPDDAGRRPRPRPGHRDRRRRRRAGGRGAGRHPGVPRRRAGDPRHRGRAGRARPAGHRDRAALLAAVGRRAAQGVRPAHRTADRAGHQRRRDVADRARHPLRRSTRGPRASPGTAMRTKVQRLPIEPVSQASARQRSGRCGAARPRHRDPALHRGGLPRPARVHRPGDPAHQPRLGAAADGRARPRATSPTSRSSTRRTAARSPTASPLLEELGALRRATGGSPRPAARWPRCRWTRGWPAWSSRPTGAACSRRCWSSPPGLTIQDPRERPAEHQQAADQLHARFADENSDFLALLNLWRYLGEQQEALSRQPVPPHGEAGVPALPAHPRVAGPARPAARHRPPARHDSWASRPPSPTSGASPPRCWPGCCRTSGLQARAGRRTATASPAGRAASTSARATPGS